MAEWKETEFGQIPVEWELKKIIDLKASEKFSIAMGPFGSNIKADNFMSEGVPVIRGTNLNYDKYVDGVFVFLTEEKADELKGSNCKAGDLVFTHRGTIGQVGLIPFGKYPRYVISQSGMKLTVDPSKVDNEYLFYFFKSKYGQHQLLKSEAQVGVPSINNPLTSLKEIEVPVPKLDEQRTIASILSSLDDKISLLHRQNKTLEELAETLFRQWFVEEAEEVSETVRLKSLGKIICGKTPSKKVPSYFGGNLPFIKIPDMHSEVFVFDTEDSLTDEGAESQASKYLPSKSICVSCIATVGLVSMNAYRSQTNQQINGIIPSKAAYRYYLYLKLKSMKNDLLARASGGTATDNLNTGDFSDIEIAKPTEELLEQYHQKVEPLFNKIYFNKTQIRTLTQLRDMLLPKLMSGEVRVER